MSRAIVLSYLAFALAGAMLAPGSGLAQTAAPAGDAISASIRPCWARDTHASPSGIHTIAVVVTTDPNGVARIVEVADRDREKVIGDPEVRALFERARIALLDPRCAALALPPSKLGVSQKLILVLSP